LEQNKRTTMYDIAEKLGISVVTVHRALHNTGRISPETKKKVLETAEEMNFQINRNAQALRRSAVRIGVILCCPIEQFCHEIERGVRAAFSDLEPYNVVHDIHILPYTKAENCQDEVRAAIDALIDNSCNAAVVFLSGPTDCFTDSFEKLENAGIPVATVVNYIPLKNLVVHVSADGYCAGRMAAELLSISCSGQRIAILTGSNSTYIHSQNLNGFLDESKKSPFGSVDVWEHYDDSRLVNEKLEAILNSEEPYQGLYITSASVINAFERLSKLSPNKAPKLVTTDLFEENRYLLKKGIACATIFQDPYKQGKTAVNRIYRHLCGEQLPDRLLIPPQIMLCSNMDYYPAAE